MSVTFCGHGNISYDSSFEEKLKNAIESTINKGETDFLLGGYGNFDLLAAHILKTLKYKYPQIKSTLVIPYINRNYDNSLYDNSVYPPLEKIPKKLAIIKRNEWAVEKSDIVIAYVQYDWGGAVQTLKYAIRKKKKIINLAPQNKNG